MKQINFIDEIIVDCFAGGGGWSTGIEQATGEPVDIAVNHDPDAILMHKTNHPYTEHYQDDIFMIDPQTVTRGRSVGWAHFSPDCKHFSKAKGKKPVIVVVADPPKMSVSDRETRQLELYNQGKPDPEIANAVGVSPQLIFVWRKKNRLPNQSKRKGVVVPPVVSEPKLWVPDPMLVEESRLMKEATAQFKAARNPSPAPSFVDKGGMFFADVCDGEPTIAHLKSGAPAEPFITPEQLDQIKTKVIALSERNAEPVEIKSITRLTDITELQPRSEWEASRKMLVSAAMINRIMSNMPIPKEWLEEYNEVSTCAK